MSNAVWRTGVVFDVSGDGDGGEGERQSLLAESVSTPCSASTRCSSPTGRGRGATTTTTAFRRTASSVPSPISGVTSRYADADSRWPYFDEVSVGVDHQLMRDFAWASPISTARTEADRLAQRQGAAVGVHRVHIGRSRRADGPGARRGCSTSIRRCRQAFQDNVFTNEPMLDTTYDGVELTAAKRFSSAWQVLLGLTFGRNEGGVATGDLNNPNNFVVFPRDRGD